MANQNPVGKVRYYLVPTIFVRTRTSFQQVKQLIAHAYKIDTGEDYFVIYAKVPQTRVIAITNEVGSRRLFRAVKTQLSKGGKQNETINKRAQGKVSEAQGNGK